MFSKHYYKQLIPGIFIGLLAISAMTFTRPLDWNRASVAQVMSSRPPLWEVDDRSTGIELLLLCTCYRSVILLEVGL